MFQHACLCGLLMMASAAAFTQQPIRARFGQVPACLHDAAETGEHRARREQGVRLAKAVIARQAEVAQRVRLYSQMSSLGNLPPAPRGFDMRLYTDGTGFVLVLKDSLDPCRFGIFADESGFVYEKAPLTAPQMAGPIR